MMRTTTGFLLAGLLACAGAAAMPADAPADARAERLADALVKMLPMGKIFADAAAANPKWPLQEKPEAVSAEQLACVRGELSVDGYRRARLEEARQYAAANPSRMDQDLALLDGGAARLFGTMVQAGADEASTGKKAVPEEILASATSEEVLSFVTFISDPAYAGLRKLSGYGDAFDVTRSAHENEKAGEQLGASLAVQLMIKAMGTCKVPPSAYM
jgi:hypothetical protein